MTGAAKAASSIKQQYVKQRDISLLLHQRDSQPCECACTAVQHVVHAWRRINTPPLRLGLACCPQVLHEILFRQACGLLVASHAAHCKSWGETGVLRQELL